jgi:hypothetical protein
MVCIVHYSGYWCWRRYDSWLSYKRLIVLGSKLCVVVSKDAFLSVDPNNPIVALTPPSKIAMSNLPFNVDIFVFLVWVTDLVRLRHTLRLGSWSARHYEHAIKNTRRPFSLRALDSLARRFEAARSLRRVGSWLSIGRLVSSRQSAARSGQ